MLAVPGFVLAIAASAAPPPVSAGSATEITETRIFGTAATARDLSDNGVDLRTAAPGPSARRLPRRAKVFNSSAKLDH
ncbi:MAG: hypothetical protein JO319_14760 [Acidobacteriaceae bacterium]|nr:hypothetical protein [Acidobacteriaceae bacterium]